MLECSVRPCILQARLIPLPRAWSTTGEAQTQSSWARLARSVGDLPAALALSLGAVRCLVDGVPDSARRWREARFRERFARHYALALDLAAAGIARRRTGAGEMALEVVEAVRSGSLAEVLRAGGFEVTGDAGSVLEHIVSLEAELLVAAPGTPGVAPGISSNRTELVPAELAELHERLAEALSPSSFVSHLSSRSPRRNPYPSD